MGITKAHVGFMLTRLRTEITMVISDEVGFYRFSRVTAHMPVNDKLYRCSAPHYIRDSDQKLTADSIEYLKDNEIEHVISVNSKARDITITKALKDNSIAYTPLPVENFHPPTMKDLETGNTEYRKHRAGTLVWCGFGWGRTRTMISGLQIYAEKGKSSSMRLTRADYDINLVEEDEQRNLLDDLQDQKDEL